MHAKPCSVLARLAVGYARRRRIRFAVRVHLEPLENRTLMAVTAALVGNTLDVDLTAGSDHARIQVTGSNTEVVDVNTSTTVFSTATSNVAAFDVDGNNSGGQQLTIQNSFTLSGGVDVAALATIQVSGSLTLGGSLALAAQTVNIAAAVSTATNNQPITITANAIAITTAISVSSGAGTITLQPDDDSDVIGLENTTTVGGVNCNANLNLSAGEIQALSSSGTVIIGRSTGTGPICIARRDPGGNVINLASEQFNLTIRGGATTFHNKLTLATDKTLTLLTGAISDNSNPASQEDINGTVSATVHITSTGSVSVDTSLGRYGTIAAGGSIDLSNTSAAGISPTLSLTGPISSSNNPISLANNATFAIIQNAGATVNAGTSTATITADSMTLADTITANGGVTLQPTTASRPIKLNNSAGSSDLELSAAELGQLSSTGTVTIGRSGGAGAIAIGGSGAIDLSGESFGLTLRGGTVAFANGLTLANDKTLTLNTAAVTSGVGVDVTIGGAGAVSASTSGAIGASGNPFSTAVATLSATTSGNNNMFLSETDSLTWNTSSADHSGGRPV
jgi:filamentous hemagglutinin